MKSAGAISGDNNNVKFKLLLVGSDKVYAIENHYALHIRELGVEVVHFPAQRLFYDYYQKNVLRKIWHRLGFSNIIDQINQEFLRLIDAEKPDIVLIFKGMEITPTSLLAAKNKGVLLANYNPDNPFLFSGKGSGNSNVTNSIPLFDLHLTYNLSIAERLKAETKAAVEYLPFGYELSESLFLRCAKQPEIQKVCFLGNPDQNRAAQIRALAEMGLKIDVYGHDWGKFLTHPDVQIFPAVYGDDFWLTLSRYRVQLNLMRMHNEDSHNMRTFEVPGVGGIMLAPNTREHRKFFEDKKECYLFDSIAHCNLLAMEILALTQPEANKIRNQALACSIGRKYSYKARAEFLVHKLNDLKSQIHEKND